MSARDDVLSGLVTAYQEFAGSDDMLHNPEKYAREDLNACLSEEAASLAQKLRAETAAAYPRIAAERGSDYAAGWQHARQCIAEQLEGA